MQAPSHWTEICRQVTALYQQWQVLTEAEGTAIGEQDWLAVEQRQTAKQRLRQRISSATEALRTALALEGIDPAAVEDDLRKIVANLIAKENANRELLDRVRKNSLERLAALNKTEATLRQVRRAYTGVRPSVWQRYS